MLLQGMCTYTSKDVAKIVALTNCAYVQVSVRHVHDTYTHVCRQRAHQVHNTSAPLLCVCWRLRCQTLRRPTRRSSRVSSLRQPLLPPPTSHLTHLAAVKRRFTWLYMHLVVHATPRGHMIPAGRACLVSRRPKPYFVRQVKSP